MAAVIIKQKDVKRLGKEVLNEMFNFLHDEYILTEFEEMKEVKKEFLNNLMLNHINTLRRKFKITEEKRKELVEPFFKPLFLGDNENSLIEEKSIPDELELKVNAMRDDGIDSEGIYQTLNFLKLDMEIDEDLYFKTKAFLDIYRVFESAYTYLE